MKKFQTVTVATAMKIDKIKETLLRTNANRFPRAAISAGNWMKPTVTQAVIRAVTA